MTHGWSLANVIGERQSAPRPRPIKKIAGHSGFPDQGGNSLIAFLGRNYRAQQICKGNGARLGGTGRPMASLAPPRPTLREPDRRRCLRPPTTHQPEVAHPPGEPPDSSFLSPSRWFPPIRRHRAIIQLPDLGSKIYRTLSPQKAPTSLGPAWHSRCPREDGCDRGEE
jgi:hypothetical protein